MTRQPSASGESALGDLVADATLEGARALGAQIAFMNNGGIRKELEAGADLIANVSQVQIVLPFSKTLVLMTMSGAQIWVLEQQFPHPQTVEGRSLLQISQGFTYRWDASQPAGRRIEAGSMLLNGKPLTDAASYQVVANNFLADGGDNFPIFKQASGKRDTGILDLDAFTRYLIQRDRAGRPAARRRPRVSYA